MVKKHMALGVIVFLAGILLIYAWGFYKNKRPTPSPDEQRVRDVLSLSWRVMLYHDLNGALPYKLSMLNKSGYWKIPSDPITSSPYDYKIIGRDTFRICAKFSAASTPGHGQMDTVHYGDPVVHGYGYWIHQEGVQCIDRRVIRQ